MDIKKEFDDITKSIQRNEIFHEKILKESNRLRTILFNLNLQAATMPEGKRVSVIAEELEKIIETLKEGTQRLVDENENIMRELKDINEFIDNDSRI